MSLSDANKIQENSGVSSGTTNHVVSLGSGTTAGNTLLVITYSQAALTAPSGVGNDVGAGSAGAINYWRKPPDQLGASETSWTFTTAANAEVEWYVAEYSNIDSVDPVDVLASHATTSVGNGGTKTSGTTTQDAGLSVVALASWAVDNAGSWGSHTNSFVEVADVGTTLGLGVAELFHDGTTRTFESTATRTTGGSAGSCVSRLVVYRAADAPISAPLAGFLSFGWGSAGGMALSTPSNPQGSSLGAGGTWGTNYLIGSSYARSGYATYGLRIVNQSSIVCSLGGNSAGTSAGLHIRPISGTGVCLAAYMDVSGSSNDLQLVYDFTNNKWGVRWGAAGTPSYQSGTTALNAWAWIDLGGRVGTSTWSSVWQLETATDTYTSQTPPTDLTGQSATTFASLVLGTNAAQTGTFELCVPVWSRYRVAYPLTPHKGQTLLVDPSGTPSVSGTTANFNVFTANGTLAAWNATNARNAVDDLPPTISASADGVVQVTAAATEYMEFAMADPTVASDEVVAAVRSVVPLWGGTGTGTGTLGIRVSDGTTETQVDIGSTAYDADSLTAESGTYPLWRSKLIPPPTNGWTVAKANSLVTRVGYSSDATPDMGVHAIYCEVATRKASTYRQVTVEDPITATVDLLVNPYNSATVSYLITNNDASRSVNFNYALAGTPQTPVTVSPSSNQTVSINADAFGDVSDLSLEPQ